MTAAGERKQCFAEYITQSKKREKEEEREKRKKAKDSFIDALSAWKDLKLTTRYKDSAEHFYNEEWFKLLEEDERGLADRLCLWQSFKPLVFPAKLRG